MGRPFSNCINRCNCEFRTKGTRCNQTKCEYYKKEVCIKLSKPPYICNGCKERSKCTLSKQFYDACYSQKEYSDNLKEAKIGITYTEEEINRLNEILKPLIVEQGQSIHHAYLNNRDLIMCSEKEIYNLIDIGALEIKNIDLPRKVRYRNKPKRTTYYKIDKKCLGGRKYIDFLNYTKENTDINIVEMDSVEGKKGGKVLLTIHFVNCNFMSAFIRDHNDSLSSIVVFSQYLTLIRLSKRLLKYLFS